jgi:AMP-binding enzyme C-terminal domain
MTPDALAGRWQTAVVLKRDVFSTVERGTFRGDQGDVPGVLRRLDEVPWWSRPLARHLFNRERRALALATPLGISPPLLYADDSRLVRGYIPGSALKIARPYGDHAYFRSARAALRALHRARISHNDLAKEQNWLRTPDGRAYLLDFQLASVFARRGWLFRMAAREDLRHFLKHKRRYIPDAVTPAERRVLARKSLPTRIWMMTGKKLYMLVTRGLLGFIDSEGGGARLAYDAPAIEAALKTFPRVRDAAVLDFPDRKSGTGLYAFVEADAALREDEVRKQLAQAVGADKLPEFIQIADALPRRGDGLARRDVLRLISTNQVDLIEPAMTSNDERQLVDRLVASRKNLYGAPAIAAALISHPDVRDAAVLAYPDRLTGTGLYAFVEAREATSEDKLAAYVVGAVGRDNAPTFIQVVPALPRNTAGHVRTDILQLVATNQVDSIDPLITSDVERATVERILNARHNMRDRFVL